MTKRKSGCSSRAALVFIQPHQELAGWLAGRSRPPRLGGMKTLDDVVIQLEKHGLQLEKHTTQFDRQTAELEKQSETLDEVVRMAREIQTSQSALANAVTLLVSQLADQKATHARLSRLEEEIRQLKDTH